MECLNCGAALGRENRCPACGADMKLFQRIVHTSNSYYNEGLDRARTRDLSGAATCLRNSLKFYKMNIQARNLLGLVYFEMGETVDAIEEWVISRSLKPQNNPAEGYLASVQTHGSKLDSLNQTIKKYNQALLYCRQGSEDLAVIQLKKVLSMNPRLVKGHQLLALLYMKQGNYEQAKKSLRNASRIDANNTTTFRYLREVNQELHKEQPAPKSSRKNKDELVSYQSGNETIIHPANFKDNSAWTTVWNMALGIVIGVLITWFLVVPSVRQSSASEVNQAVREANDTISTKEQTILGLEEQISDLESQMEELQTSAEDSKSVLDVYEQLLTAYESYAAQDFVTAGETLEQIDDQVLSSKAKELYDTMTAQVDAQYIVTLYQEGEAAYNSQDYATAAEKLQGVIEIQEDYEDGYAMYHLAHSYRNLDQKEQALACYQRFIELKPNTSRAKSAAQYVAQLQAEIGQQ